MRNLCENTSVELYLSADGTTLSTSSGSSVQLPDPSSTNELQQLALSGNQISISSGNAVQLPMLQDWLTVYPNKADSTTAPTEKQFTFLAQGLKSGTVMSFDLTTASVLINKSGTYLLSLTVTHWSDPNAQIVRSSRKKQDGSYAVVVTLSQTTGLQVSSTQIVHLNGGDTLRWFLSGGNIAIGDASNASGINILLLREDWAILYIARSLIKTSWILFTPILPYIWMHHNQPTRMNALNEKSTQCGEIIVKFV